MRRARILTLASLLSVALALPLALPLGGCASTDQGSGLSTVDDLLTRVEQVQIESLVAREKASAAFEAFNEIVAPDFKGEPMSAFKMLVERIEASKTQAQKLADGIAPMERVASRVFFAWTADLENFGNTNLRQASQARLAETQSRYSIVRDAAVAALVSMKAFNSDLNDQALFLEHDFNASAVSVIAMELPALTNQARDLGKRLNVVAAAAKTYIAASALRGEVQPGGEQAPGGAQQAPAAANPPTADGVQPKAAPQDAPQVTTAPAKRRPRDDANTTAPVQPTSQPAPTSSKPATASVGGR